MLTLHSPAFAHFDDPKVAEGLRKYLSYTDKSVNFELQKAKKGLRYSNSAALQARIAELTAKAHQTLLFKDDKGTYTYAGLAKTILEKLGLSFPEALGVDYLRPLPTPMKWDQEPEHPDREYQTEAVQKLLEAAKNGPASISCATGLGKSRIIMNSIRELGLPAVVMAPSVSIARQIYSDLQKYLGKNRVGLVGDGQKDFKKMVVVGIADSLTRIKPDSPAWRALSKKPVFWIDESHLVAARTLKSVAHGLMGAAPWRFSCSGTQERNDGLDLVLEGIIGPVVLEKTVREGVDEGYLARPYFRMVQVPANGGYYSSDANSMTRHHLFYNDAVNQQAADIANKAVSAMKRPTLILVDEIEQFSRLLPHFKHVAKFAHGPLTKENEHFVPEEYRTDNPRDLVDRFNRGEIPILVGTNCVSTGTNFTVPAMGIYLAGGKSRIKVKQSLGRMTRCGYRGTVQNPWTGIRKDDAIWVDFCVDVEILEKHAKERVKIYNEVYGPVEWV